MTPEEQKQHYQPHFQEITRQDQVQIYQELTQDPQGKLTTSFLSIAHRLKDNRSLPKGWDPNPKLAEREGLGQCQNAYLRTHCGDAARVAHSQWAA